jgi:tRNA pseudouridine55 synthase
MQCGGFFLVDKPAGPTSNRVLQDIRRGFLSEPASRGLKFGHAGTLDSFASGLLLVLVGTITRLTPWFMHQKKEYEAIFRFGEETDTLDPLGKVIASAKRPTLTELEVVLPQFRGTVFQIPPSYSAVHVDGKRSYKIAQTGEVPELSPRPVSIERLELLRFEGGEAVFSIQCSSGTYVRALARDIGRACGSRAFVQALRRTRIGEFALNAAYAPVDCTAGKIHAFTVDIARDIGLGAGILRGEFLVRFQHGSALPQEAVNLRYGGASVVALFTEGNEFIGLVERRGEDWSARMVALEELWQ